jgi:hypothetical protein
MSGIVVNVDLTPFIYIWLSLATILATVSTVKAVRNIWRG